MTTFQLLSVALFTGVLLVSNKDAVLAWIKNVSPTPAKPAKPVRDTIVDELEIVVDLRQKFIDADCDEGVAACNVLLRVLIDHPHPHGS
jgi:hypothetical protein